MAVVVSVATTYAETPADGTVSVLKTEAPQAAQTTVTPTITPVACEEARVVKLAPWQVRRLNRVADRQEARDSRNCCCKDSCGCNDDCCKKPKTLVLESRRKCDCCK